MLLREMPWSASTPLIFPLFLLTNLLICLEIFWTLLCSEVQQDRKQPTFRGVERVVWSYIKGDTRRLETLLQASLYWLATHVIAFPELCGLYVWLLLSSDSENKLCHFILNLQASVCDSTFILLFLEFAPEIKLTNRKQKQNKTKTKQKLTTEKHLHQMDS